MKKVLFALCIFGLMAGMCSCNKDKEALGPTNHIWIIKLKKAEYKDFVIANDTKGDSIVAYRFNHVGEPLGKSGYSPYWELPDGWLLIDWKWHNFPYLIDEVLLLDEPWENFTHLLQTWSKDRPHASKPVQMLYTFDAEELAAYLHKDYSNIIAYIEPNYDAVAEMGKDAYVSKKDSVWTILRQDLSTIVKDNDLDKVSSRKPYICE